jgi:VWFA-related protein
MPTRVILSSMITLLTAAAAIVGQVPTPLPSPSDTDVVKITTSLVQIDVTVTDRDHHVVHDLQPSDFEIYQNGKREEITNFSFISNFSNRAPGNTEHEGEVVLPPMPPAVTPLRAASIKRTIALVVDDLNLSFGSIYQVQRALRKFVERDMLPGDLVAIIRTGAGVGALQQFTADKRQLYAAIDRVKFNAAGTGHVGVFEPIQGKNDLVGLSKLKNPDSLNSEDEQFKGGILAVGTLGALNFVIRGMEDLPGRKSIMMFSDGFSLYPMNSDGDRQTDLVFRTMKQIVDRANRAAVVINTLDARGLAVTGLTAADDTRGYNSTELQQKEADRGDEIIATQEGLLDLAYETGGRAILNNNDIGGSLEQLVDDQSYYLIGYVPDDQTFKPGTSKYNNLSVKVGRPGLLVQYRSSFLATPEKRPDPLANLTPVKKLQYALTSPFAINDITLNLNALYQGVSNDGSHIRSLLHIRGADLLAVDAGGGKKKISFDLLAVTLGDNGNPVDQLSKTFELTLTPDQYKQVRERGFVYDFVFPVKKPGAYQMRLAIHDRNSDKVGSANEFIEIPDLGKHRLTLSSVALESVRLIDLQNGTRAEANNALVDTALRQLVRGRGLRYAFLVFNAAGQPADLTQKIRLIKDGKVVFEGSETPIAASASQSKAIPFIGAMTLGTSLDAGDYTLEITVHDNNRHDASATARQYVPFELVSQ